MKCLIIFLLLCSCNIKFGDLESQEEVKEVIKIDNKEPLVKNKKESEAEQTETNKKNIFDEFERFYNSEVKKKED